METKFDYGTYKGGAHIFKYKGNDETIIVPSMLDDVPVREIMSFAFSNCKSLKSIILPESVTRIGWSAFDGCTSLESITLPNKLTKIERSTFYNCRSLKSIILPDSLTEIGSFAFYNCMKLKSITIPSSVNKIEMGAFKYCKLAVYCDLRWKTRLLDYGVTKCYH